MAAKAKTGPIRRIPPSAQGPPPVEFSTNASAFTAEKDSKPQGTLQAMVAGLSVGPEPGLSGINQFGPAIAALVHLLVLGLMLFNLIPNLQVAALVLAFTGPVAASWAAKLGAK